MSTDEAAIARQRLLQEAQGALLQRRAALQEARSQEPAPVAAHGCFPYPKAAAQSQSLADLVRETPAHLAWENARLTEVVRRALANRQRATEAVGPRQWLVEMAAQMWTPASPAPSAGPDSNSQDPAAHTAVLYPDLAQAILRHKLAAPGRLWHLLRVLDVSGRGWLDQQEAAAAFTVPDAPLRFCGSRQLQNLLQRGNGLFWKLDERRIWLRAPGRVALALGQTTLSARPVTVPAQELCRGIARVRAHFYASWHSSRTAAPVSRRRLAARCGVAPRTQRTYDRKSGVRRAPNFARGPHLNTAAAEKLAWRKGPASFTWSEQGQCPAGKADYLAWQLPNSYNGPHEACAKGRQKRARRHLADLLTKGTAGNDQVVEDWVPARTYFACPRAAAQAYGRSAAPVYWPSARSHLWYCLW